MEYNLATAGALWSAGIFNIPKSLVDNYIKLASEYQLKALLIILSRNGRAQGSDIAEILGITEKDAESIMQFWVNEGIISANGNTVSEYINPAGTAGTALTDIHNDKPEKFKKQKLTISAPILSPKDIVQAIEENEEIAELMNEAQVTLGRTISHAEREMLVNLVNFYGMGSEIILMILDYCRSKNDSGRKTSTAYILKIAENWIEEGIDTIAAAEEKLIAIEQSDRLWNEIIQLTGIRHRKPSQKQRDMIMQWSRDFSFDMIALAIDEMKEYSDAPSLPYVNKILTNWKKAGVSTPADAAKAKEEFTKAKESSAKQKPAKAGEITSKPTYDLEQIKKDARNNTEIKY